jgi:hypothetical protein
VDTVGATVPPIDQPTVKQAFDHRLDIVRRPSKCECHVIDGWQTALVLGCKAQQINPRLEVIPRKELHLGVVQGVVIETEPAAHASTTLMRRVNSLCQPESARSR